MKWFIKKLTIVVVTLFILFIYIKRDYEAHFNTKLEIHHNDYIRFYTTKEEKIRYHGFDYEEHKIKTDDGYILTAWRIIYDSDKDIEKNKKVVIINHGLLNTAYTFLAHDEEKSLPFILARNGYDVWLPNNRGTTFSYEHEDESKNSFDVGSDYWDFSFHEMAKFDIIANIKYIKETTKKDKINYVCHSQGCLQFLIGYTIFPEFFDNSIHKFGTMGSVLKYKHINKSVTNLLKNSKIFEWLEYFGIKNIMSFHEKNVKMFGYLCHRALWICRFVISSIISNEETNHIDWEGVSNNYYYQPGGTSSKNLNHWFQTLGSDTVRHYDYGKDKNREIYNNEFPPEYNFEKLSQITFDIFITTTSGDPYCLNEDVKLMIDTFTRAKVTTKDVGKYNHLDYLWGKDAHIDIYTDILAFLNDS